MSSTKIFLLVDGLLFLVLLFFVIRNGIRGVKLTKAMDHFKAPEIPGDVLTTEEIVDTIEFTQDYSKNLKLHNALQKDEDFYILEVAKVLAAELVKNKAVDIEFIQGVERDTIKGKIKYVVKV